MIIFYIYIFNQGSPPKYGSVDMIIFSIGYRSYGPRREKTCLRGFANNKGADEPVHPRSLISAFVICLLVSIISRHAMSVISKFWLVPVAEETRLSLALSETPKTGFLATRPIYYNYKGIKWKQV